MIVLTRLAGQPNGTLRSMLNDQRIWSEVPAGFKQITDAHGSRLVVRQDQERFISIPLCRDSTSQEGSSRFEGREKIRSIKLPDGETALIRSYRHGGLFRHITGSVFFTWPPRPFRELRITEELRQRGIPTVEVYGACVEPLTGPLYRGWLITRELKGSRDLWSGFRSGFVREVGIERVLHAVARSLRSLHREGVYHRDLNLKNILVRLEPAGVKGYIIDFDKAKLFFGTLPPGLVKRNMDRLLRSIRKLDPDREYFSATDWHRFFEFYHAADGDD
jgi:hypothetical protein